MGQIYQINHGNETYLIDDNFHLDPQIGEIYMLDAFNKFNNTEDIFDYLWDEYKFSRETDYGCEDVYKVENKNISIEIFEDGSNDVKNKMNVKKSDVLSMIHEYRNNNKYKEIGIEYCDTENVIYAVAR